MTNDALLLTVEQAAEMCGISRSHAYQMLNSGMWPAVRLGRSCRIPRAWLCDWLESETRAWDASHAGLGAPSDATTLKKERLNTGGETPTREALAESLQGIQATLKAIERQLGSMVSRRGEGISSRRNIPKAVRDAVIQRDGRVCRYCGKKVTGETMCLDHIVPVVKGGRTEVANLVVCCLKCNRKKGTNLLDEIGMTLRFPLGDED